MTEGFFDEPVPDQRAATAGEREEPQAFDTSPPPSDVYEVAPISAGRMQASGLELFVLSLPSPVARLPSVLTEAERHVAALVLDGLSNRAIAEARGTSVRTVANQIASVFRKLNVTGRAELGDATARSLPR